MGATYAIYEGVAKLKHPHPPENLQWAYWVLAISFVLEAGSICLAIYQEVKEAHHEGQTFFAYLRDSKDPTAKTVIFEDSAALLGSSDLPELVSILPTSLRPWGWRLLGWSIVDRDWPGVGSCSVCARPDIARLAVGRSGNQEGRGSDHKSNQSHPDVVRVVELLTMHLAPKDILINAHINLRDDLVTGNIVQTVEEIEDLIKRAEPKVTKIFLVARASESSEPDVVLEHMG